MPHNAIEPIRPNNTAFCGKTDGTSAIETRPRVAKTFALITSLLYPILSANLDANISTTSSNTKLDDIRIVISIGEIPKLSRKNTNKSGGKFSIIACVIYPRKQAETVNLKLLFTIKTLRH
jgi:hypothetical protein